VVKKEKNGSNIIDRITKLCETPEHFEIQPRNPVSSMTSYTGLDFPVLFKEFK